MAPESAPAFGLVRGMMQSLLQLERFPVGSRLFFIAFFAERARLDFAAPIDPLTLNRLIHTMRQAAVLDQLHAQFVDMPSSATFGMSVVNAMLEVLGPRVTPSLAESSLTSFERIDPYVECLALDYVMRDEAVTRPSLLHEVTGLLARAAVMRFVLTRRGANATNAELDATAASMTRAFDHRSASIDHLVDALAAQDLTTLAHSVCLLKL